ncbi:hypothetical protein [Litoreibacter roseus]|uniref:Uncharacterized protein n=1 Tax=Litoreibacter roseus TaxID=2601869 RepID=A0A6N6JD47_9RHOB|nr:hypothetical protein KIN_03120 [Litoreibacter roseus]
MDGETIAWADALFLAVHGREELSAFNVSGLYVGMLMKFSLRIFFEPEGNDHQVSVIRKNLASYTGISGNGLEISDKRLLLLNSQCEMRLAQQDIYASITHL